MKPFKPLSKIGKILSKIIYICCIIGAVGCIVGPLSLNLGNGSLINIVCYYRPYPQYEAEFFSDACK